MFRKVWTTPTGTQNPLCMDILKQPHAIIAGATGSGKSVLINAIIYNTLYQAPTETQFILIDPKRVELVQYKKLPHTIIYASDENEIVLAINQAVNIMENRFKRMQRNGQRETDQSHIYIIIDEFADLMTMYKKQVLKPLCRIAQLGRAAHVHLIIATQRPTSDIINGQIKVNIDCRVALRCPTKRDSQNIINASGAELLPKVGYCYYSTPTYNNPVLNQVPYRTDNELNKRVKHWTKQNRLFKLL